MHAGDRQQVRESRLGEAVAPAGLDAVGLAEEQRPRQRRLLCRECAIEPAADGGAQGAHRALDPT